jgi:hydroxymethylpyrimidine/phosphomethylpyrimidine kinase
MDDIRSVYAHDYCAALISREDIDTLLSKCTVQVTKRGMIKYTQFIQVLQRTQLDPVRAHARKTFNRFDERRLATAA